MHVYIAAFFTGGLTKVLKQFPTFIYIKICQVNNTVFPSLSSNELIDCPESGHLRDHELPGYFLLEAPCERGCIRN